MKLSLKLSLAFGLLTTIIVGLGLSNLMQMGRINDTSTDIARNWLPSVVNIQRIDTLTADFRSFEIRHIFSENPADMRRFEERLAAARDEMAKSIDAYAKLIELPEEKALYDEYMRLRLQYRDVHVKLLALSRDMKTAEAVVMLDGESYATYQKVRDVLDKIVNLNIRGGNKASDAGDVLYASVTKMVIALLIFSVLVAIAITVYMVRNTLGLLGKDPAELGTIARAVAGGNLELEQDDKAVGVYKDIRAMVANLKKNIEAAKQESERAREESVRAQEAMQQAEAAGKDAAAKAESMLRAADRLEEVAGIVSSASEELSAQVEQSERGAAEQAARVSEMATAMEEMNCTVMEVARNAGEASDATARTRGKAEGGAGVVQRAVQSIEKVQKQSLALKEDMAVLGQHAQSISEIMGVISDIADQTNLLALNAAIEAARAGEAGRGFAVVADEVRKLAEKTMQSTTDVGNAIKAIQESAEKNIRQVDATVADIETSTTLAVQSGESLEEIVSMVDTCADQVRAIATASEQQSATSEEINRAVTQVNSIASETARAMQEAARAVSDLAGQAQALSGLIDDMKRG